MLPDTTVSDRVSDLQVLPFGPSGLWPVHRRLGVCRLNDTEQRLCVRQVAYRLCSQWVTTVTNFRPGNTAACLTVLAGLRRLRAVGYAEPLWRHPATPDLLLFHAATNNASISTSTGTVYARVSATLRTLCMRSTLRRHPFLMVFQPGSRIPAGAVSPLACRRAEMLRIQRGMGVRGSECTRGFPDARLGRVAMHRCRGLAGSVWRANGQLAASRPTGKRRRWWG